MGMWPHLLCTRSMCVFGFPVCDLNCTEDLRMLPFCPMVFRFALFRVIKAALCFRLTVAEVILFFLCIEPLP